jgi:hypothetical protein
MGTAVFKKSAARRYTSISSLISKRAQKTYSSRIETSLRFAAAGVFLATRDEIWLRMFSVFVLQNMVVFSCFNDTHDINVLTPLQHHEPSRQPKRQFR